MGVVYQLSFWEGNRGGRGADLGLGEWEGEGGGVGGLSMLDRNEMMQRNEMTRSREMVSMHEKMI